MGSIFENGQSNHFVSSDSLLIAIGRHAAQIQIVYNMMDNKAPTNKLGKPHTNFQLNLSSLGWMHLI